MVLGTRTGRRIFTHHRIAEQVYGYQPIIQFLLTKGGKILTDDESRVTFSEGEPFIDKETGKPVSNLLRFVYQDQTQHYVITYRRERDIKHERLIETMMPAQRGEAEKEGFDGAYLRFTGPCTLECFEGDQVIESVQQPAIWEMMYFGKVPEKGEM